MPLVRHFLLIVLTCYAAPALGDRYASNQNAVVPDSPQVAANFPDIERVTLRSPAFINPGTIPSGWLNGTSGPTPQNVLGVFVNRKF
jgi:hypothetical protein